MFSPSDMSLGGQAQQPAAGQKHPNTAAAAAQYRPLVVKPSLTSNCSYASKTGIIYSDYNLVRYWVIDTEDQLDRCCLYFAKELG